jgi:hypothetical protein
MHDVQRRYGVMRKPIKMAPRGSAEDRRELVEYADKLKRYHQRYGSG